MKSSLSSYAIFMIILCSIVPFQLYASQPDTADLYSRAEQLYLDEKYDEVIELLDSPCRKDPICFDLNVLLAKAQLEKCAILKEDGDESYESLINKPYKTALRLHKMGKMHPDLYYIAAKSLFLNDRAIAAQRTIKKALYFLPDNTNYLILMGDICRQLANNERDESAVHMYVKTAHESYEKALQLAQNDKNLKRTILRKRLDIQN